MGVFSGRHTGYGRPVLTATTTGPLPRLRVWRIPGCDRTLTLRDGSVGFLLIHFALWWHETINPLDKGAWDEWGYAVRPTRTNSAVTSEHAGGGAADLDATQHPQGVPILRTFKRWQIRRIRKRLKVYTTHRGVMVLGWGGDYKRTPDGMHVEWAKGAGLVDAEEVARRLIDTGRGRRILAANPGARDVILS